MGAGRVVLNYGRNLNYIYARTRAKLYVLKVKKNALVVCTLRHGFMNTGLYG